MINANDGRSKKMGMDTIKSYTLVISDWRCGAFAPPESGCSLGVGDTVMLDVRGRMCCLGQFARQAGVTQDNLLNEGTPVDVAHNTGKAYDSNFVVPASEAENPEAEKNTRFEHTPLASKLMRINDSRETTIAEKVSAIRAVLESHGIQLQVIYPDGDIQ